MMGDSYNFSIVGDVVDASLRATDAKSRILFRIVFLDKLD